VDFIKDIKKRIKILEDRELVLDKLDVVVEFLEKHESLLRMRPATFLHNDYGSHNIMISSNGSLTIFDFGNHATSDAWSDFRYIVPAHDKRKWREGIKITSFFSTGCIHGYFDVENGNNIPQEFWSLFALYTILQRVASLTYYLKKPEILTRRIKELEDDLYCYNDMKALVPIWYENTMDELSEKQNIFPYIQSDSISDDAVKVSVIIPCYNAAQYLEECLDTILHQTLKEIEVICVDDGSTDSTVEILKKYAQRDERFNFLVQENQFAGVARNAGMAIAKGKYLSFLDSDDFFEPMMLEHMYRQAERDQADICITGGGTYDMRAGFVSYRYRLRHNFLPEKIPFSWRDAPDNIFKLSYIAPWCKMFRKSFIQSHGLKYQALERANDLFFNQSAMAVAERITVVDGWLFTYRIGTTTSLVETTDENPLCFAEANFALKAFLGEKNIYKEVSRSFKEIALSNGVYTLNMTKTKEGWLKTALFLKNSFIPELALENCFDFMQSSDKNIRMLRFLMDKSDQDLCEYEPLLRSAETITDNIPEWNFELNNNPIKVSVIVPVYNCEDYLEECLTSVLNQTLNDIEIICVNDGSTDNSLSLLNHYAEKDSRVKVISQKNKGLSSVRNTAVNYATGEYVMFVDSDDVLLKISLEHLYRKAYYNHLDELFCESAVFYESRDLYYAEVSKLNYYKYKGEYPSVLSGINLLERLVKENNFRPSACLQLIRLDFLKDNNIYFEEGMIYEDNIFTLTALTKAKRVSIHQEELYLRRVRDNSITTKGKGFKNLHGLLKCVLFVESLAENEAMDSSVCRILSEKYEWLFLNCWDEIVESTPVISNEMLEGMNNFLSTTQLSLKYQRKYIEYIIRSFVLEGSSALVKDGEVKNWLKQISIALKLVDEKLIADTLNKIKVDDEISNEFDQRDRSGRYIFGQGKEHDKNKVISLFSVGLQYVDTNNVSLVVDFMFMGRYTSLVKNTLNLSLSLKNNGKGVLKAVVHQAEWENGEEGIFLENFYYIFKENVFTIFAKHTGLDTGFEYRIKDISSRGEKIRYSVTFNHHGYGTDELLLLTDEYTPIKAVKLSRFDAKLFYGKRIMFRNAKAAGKGINLFSVELAKIESNGIIFAVDMTYLAKERTGIYDTLFLSFSLGTYKEKLKATVKQAEWQHGYKLLKENVYYYIENSAIIVGVRHNGPWCGYNYKITHITGLKKDDDYTILDLAPEFVESGMKDLSKSNVFVKELIDWDK